MKNKEEITLLLCLQAGKVRKSIPEGYPLYPGSEDIYERSEKEEELNPEDPEQKKAPNERVTGLQDIKEEFRNDVSGKDLDIPGTDEDNEDTSGNDDEENRLYSLASNDLNEPDTDNGG